VVAVVASVALAGGPGGRGMMRGMGMMGPEMHGGTFGLGMLLHRADLTDEQRDTVRAIVEAEQPALAALRESIRAAREAFREAHPPTEFDESAIRAHHAELAPLLADLAVAEARVRARAFAVLTPEQLADVQSMQSRMRERLERRQLRREP